VAPGGGQIPPGGLSLYRQAVLAGAPGGLMRFRLTARGMGQARILFFFAFLVCCSINDDTLLGSGDAVP